MLIDARGLATGTTLSSDVCIVGAGPAGLTLARRLRGRRRKIMVLERGGEPGRPLGVGDSEVALDVTSPFEPPPSIPPRAGGGANEWIVRLPWMRRGVRMVPLMPIDFEQRSWVPDSGWPVTASELEPYVRRACQELGLGDRGFGLEEWDPDGSRRLQLDEAGLTTVMERFPRSSVFTSDIWQDLIDADDVEIVLHAPVGCIEGDVDRVDHLDIDEGTPGRLRASAPVFVLAGGGLTNPRLLLSARSGRGIGAASDAVGRYYMDHFRYYSGSIVPDDRRVFDRASLYDIGGSEPDLAMGKLVPSPEVQRAREILNSASMLLPKPADELQGSLDRVRGLLASARDRGRPPARVGVRDAARVGAFAARLLPEMAVRQRRIPPHTDAGWSDVSGNRHRYESFLVESQIEQAPDRANGLRLTGDHDAFGRPLASLEWRWSDLDIRTMRETQRVFAEAVASSGLGRFVAAEWEDSPDLTTPGGAFHPTGGTRMSTDVSAGVVDADTRVHGVTNLFVAGSSVFPTCGYANPTLTILALTHRLADLIDRPAPSVADA